MPEIEQEPSGKPNSSFQVGADLLNLLLFYADLMFFQVLQILKLTNPMFLLFGFLRLSLSIDW